MRKPITLLLLAAAAFAGDFETRYHEAYVLEVVEGDVADAARAYLDLLREKELPRDLRARTEFRFAVTCVLLGRADEARARLAALAADPATSAPMRAQIEEYRKALEDVAPGRELDKELRELKVKLGKQAATFTTPQVFRDFQIMGEAAFPFLRRLLSHPDRILRKAAFRVLCTMDAPGLAAAWKPDLGASEELEAYLVRHADEHKALREHLRAASKEALPALLNRLRTVPFDLAFVAEMARRPGTAAAVIGMVQVQESTDELRSLLETWIRGEDATLASRAAALYVDRELDVRPDLFRVLCRASLSFSAVVRGLRPYAAEMPADVLESTFTWMLENESRRFLQYGLSDVLADALFEGERAGRYEELFWRWLDAASEGPYRGGSIGRHLRTVLVAMPSDRAEELVRKIFSKRTHPYVRALGFERPEDVPLIRAALSVVEEEERKEIVEALADHLEDGPTPAYAAAVAPLYLEHFRLLPGKLGLRFIFLSLALEEEAAAEAARRVLAHVRRLPEEKAVETLWDLFGQDGADDALVSRFRQRMAPLLEEAVQRTRPEVRRHAVLMGIKYLEEHERYSLGGKFGVLVRGLVRRNLGALDHEEDDFDRLEALAEFIPPEVWLPYVKGSIRDMRWLEDHAEQVSRHFEENPAAANRAVVEVVEAWAPGRIELLTGRLIAKGRREIATMLVDEERHVHAGADALEAAMVREDLPLTVVGQLAQALAAVRPTEKLFPVVRRLLASRERDAALLGVTIAKDLGSEELLPDLVKQLDSLDGRVRDNASSAIESILLLRGIKEEFKEQIEKKDAVR